MKLMLFVIVLNWPFNKSKIEEIGKKFTFKKGPTLKKFDKIWANIDLWTRYHTVRRENGVCLLCLEKGGKRVNLVLM